MRLSAVVVTATMGIVGLGVAVPSGANAQSLVRSCTPELVYSFVPGREMDVTSVGSGHASNLVYTDALGNPQPTGTADFEWSSRAVLEEPERGTGTLPWMSGSLDIVIETGAGEELNFHATCMAAVVGIPFGVGIWANGITTGWPGGREARRTFVHFESYTDDTAYLALIDGTDCRLNFDALLVTRDDPWIVGDVTLAGLPSGFVGAETSCANRFGVPIPAFRAPGLSP